MKSVIRKLQSQTGASLSFALLLFLVCTVISSIVIISATAVSGRMSEMTDMDQRYYSVTSAAELLRSLVDGKEVTIIKRTDEETQEESTYIYESNELGPIPKSEVINAIIDPTSSAVTEIISKIHAFDIDTAALYSSLVNNAAYEIYARNVVSPSTSGGNDGKIVTREFVLGAKTSDNESYDTLSVSVEETILPNRLILKVHNTPATGSNTNKPSTYALWLVFAEDTDSQKSTSEVQTTVSVNDPSTGEQITQIKPKTITVETYTYSWELIGMTSENPGAPETTTAAAG